MHGPRPSHSVHFDLASVELPVFLSVTVLSASLCVQGLMNLMIFCLGAIGDYPPPSPDLRYQIAC